MKQRISRKFRDSQRRIPRREIELELVEVEFARSLVPLRVPGSGSGVYWEHLMSAIWMPDGDDGDLVWIDAPEGWFVDPSVQEDAVGQVQPVKIPIA